MLTTAHGSAAAVVGVVDSGAQRTLLPKAFAESQLGLSPDELVADATTGMGVDPKEEDEEGFTTWSSAVPITGQIVSTGPDGKPGTWGPTFSLDPAFAEIEATLLGRSDFFEAFAVSFTPAGAADPQFALEYA